jgi:hypothetical protein
MAHRGGPPTLLIHPGECVLLFLEHGKVDSRALVSRKRWVAVPLRLCETAEISTSDAIALGDSRVRCRSARLEYLSGDFMQVILLVDALQRSRS